MAVHVPTAEATRRGQVNYMQSTVLPAPMNGMDGRLNLASNDPSFCVYAYNLVPSEFGLRTRDGYREWAIGLEQASGVGVRTIVPLHASSLASNDNDKLFAITNEGIWDATIDGGVPVLDQAFSDVDPVTAGWANHTQFTQDNGTNVLFVADEANGLYMYDPVLDSWSRPSITGVAVADIVFVVVHKQRIWLVERNTTTAYYLPVGAISGTATPFYFGGKFQYGGDLVGLYNWTLDSGAGVDDYLVAISRGGDVIPWQGEDPASAVTWQNVGTFYVGHVPIGRRIASEYGGDLHILSSFGLTSMTDLLRGSHTGTRSDVSQKVGRFLRTDMLSFSEDYGWEIRFNPSEGVMVIGTPPRPDTHLQYRMHMVIKSWAFWRGVPMVSGATYHGQFMFGTADNRLMRMDVPVDNLKLDGTPGQPIEFSLLTNFVDMQQPGIFKWGEYSRPNWLSLREPTYESKWVYDYVTSELSATGATSDTEQPLWDTALWDSGIWASGELLAFFGLRGSWGPGRAMAVAIRGNTYERLTLVSIDGTWRAAGPF